MNKLLKALIVALITIVPLSVKADETVFYTTAQGCVLNEEEYQKMTENISTNKLDELSCELIELVKDDDNIKINEGIIKDYFNPDNGNIAGINASASETYKYKTLSVTIATSTSGGSKYATVYANISWSKDPAVKSYDAIAIYAPTATGYGVSSWRLTTPNILVGAEEVVQDGIPQSMVIKSNGYGNIFGLNAKNYRLISKATVVGNPTSVRVSYQHAESSLSYDNARQFTFSTSGYGGVFNFTTQAARNAYDQMPGVNISVAW